MLIISSQSSLCLPSEASSTFQAPTTVDRAPESQSDLTVETQPELSVQTPPAVNTPPTVQPITIVTPAIQVFPLVAGLLAPVPPPIYVRPIATPSRGPKDPSSWALTEANVPIRPGVLLEVHHEDALVYEKHGKKYQGRVSGPWALGKSHVKFKVRADAARADDAGLVVFVPYHQAGISWILVVLRFLLYPFLRGGPKSRPKIHVIQPSIV